MMARSVFSGLEFRPAAFLALMLVVGLLAGSSVRSTRAWSTQSSAFVQTANRGASVLYKSDAGVGCRDATQVETETLSAARAEQPLSVISSVRTHADNGLTIVMRSTEQLEAVPEAKEAFLRVATLYEKLIQTPITVVIDVDFGATWFGQPYGEGVAGMTNPQLLIGIPLYPFLQERLLEGASSSHERTIYEALPFSVAPTDLGDTQAVVAPSAWFRALRFVDSVAQPESEPPHWGPPPAIGFNSNVSYDFDPTDGVDPGKADFEAAVSHELGHVLGFVSYAGLFELEPEEGLALSIWDIFRVRPGVSLSTFNTARRVLSSGGNQVYFAGGDEFGLSTGRPDGTGGDGRRASHWRDDEFSLNRIGIMDPTIPQGRRQTITFKDLSALDMMGYTLAPMGKSKPVISDLTADLNGDILTVRATLTDADGDPSRVQLRLIDDDNQVISQLAPITEDFGIASKTQFSRDYPGLSSVPAVTKVGLVVTDSQGNASNMAVADFSRGDSGGPKLKSAKYNKGRLQIKGKKFGTVHQVEVNGLIVAPSGSVVVGGSSKKLVVEADSFLLNLLDGPNRVRVISDGKRSNLLVMEF
jgi:hypothetical protein